MLVLAITKEINLGIVIAGKRHVALDRMRFVQADVESTCVDTFEYNKETHTLAIVFASTGDRYQYFDVEPETVEEMINANSVGRYFNANIRFHYQYEKA